MESVSVRYVNVSPTLLAMPVIAPWTIPLVFQRMDRSAMAEENVNVVDASALIQNSRGLPAKCAQLAQESVQHTGSYLRDQQVLFFSMFL